VLDVQGVFLLVGAYLPELQLQSLDIFLQPHVIKSALRQFSAQLLFPIANNNIGLPLVPHVLLDL
jgi:hypothetical protein